MGPYTNGAHAESAGRAPSQIQPGCLTHWAALEIRDRVCTEFVLK